MPYPATIEILCELTERGGMPVLGAVYRLCGTGPNPTATEIARASQLDRRVALAALRKCCMLGLVHETRRGEKYAYEPGRYTLPSDYSTHPGPDEKASSSGQTEQFSSCLTETADNGESCSSEQGALVLSESATCQTEQDSSNSAEIARNFRTHEQDSSDATTTDTARPAVVSRARRRFNPKPRRHEETKNVPNGTAAPGNNADVEARDAFAAFVDRQPPEWQQVFETACQICSQNWRALKTEAKRQEYRRLADDLIGLYSATVADLREFQRRFRRHPYYGKPTRARPDAQGYALCPTLITEKWLKILPPADVLALDAEIEAEDAARPAVTDLEVYRGSRPKYSDAASRRAERAAANRALFAP